MKDPWIATFAVIAALASITWLGFIIWVVVTILGKI